MFRAVQEFAPGPLHTRHGLRRATLCKQERAFLCPVSPCVDFYRLGIDRLAGGACRRPYSTTPSAFRKVEAYTPSVTGSGP